MGIIMMDDALFPCTLLMGVMNSPLYIFWLSSNSATTKAQRWRSGTETFRIIDDLVHGRIRTATGRWINEMINGFMVFRPVVSGRVR